MALRPVSERLRLLLAMVPWLASVGGASTAEVAKRFEMAEEEVVDLLELAACCGLPPYTPDQLMELVVWDGWVSANISSHLSRPQRLTPLEGFTLAASARAILGVPGADPDGPLARALAKLEAVLGSALAVEYDDPPLLDVVRRAVEEGEILEITYYADSRDELTQRRVEPNAVFARDGHWYLDAWCHLVAGRRLFRVDRVRAAVPSGAYFGQAQSAGSVPEAFVPGPEARVVLLEIPAEARWVVESYPTLGVEDGREGRLRVTLAVGGTAWLERLLLRLGPGATVIDPPELAEVGRRAAARILVAYVAEAPTVRGTERTEESDPN
ncbi:MAG: helix-turn-helix transcriptional regulator [Acidimicrobiales bacterium]